MVGRFGLMVCSVYLCFCQMPRILKSEPWEVYFLVWSCCFFPHIDQIEFNCQSTRMQLTLRRDVFPHLVLRKRVNFLCYPPFFLKQVIFPLAYTES